jgi:acetylornithine deacetylase/succinyl-diaminopimelate desuccinylase-like protein
VDVVEVLADLVRHASVGPGRDAGEAAVADDLRHHLDAAGLDTEVVTSPQGRASLVARLPGPTDVAPLVLLSHTDVVPADAEAWRRDPFGGEVVDGELWGRGALDMKGVAVLHAAALVELATSGATPRREVRLVAVADEETGGAEGAGWLASQRPALLGFTDGGPPPEVVGEGAFGLTGILDRPVIPIALGERTPVAIEATATGSSGHASLPPDDQAVLRLLRFVDAVAGHRPAHLHPVMREQFAVLADAADGAAGRLFRVLAGRGGPTAVRALAPVLRARAGAIGHLVADVLTPTTLAAGTAHNVVPGTASATFDARLLPDTDPDALLADLRATGRRHHVEVTERHRDPSPTSTRGPLWAHLVAVSGGLGEGAVVVPSLTPATTDLRVLRRAGATGYGWVPLVLTPELVATVHGSDERVPVAALRRAATAMGDLLRRAAG